LPAGRLTSARASLLDDTDVTAPEILIDATAIARRVRELATEIRRDACPDVPVHLIGVLKGAFVFLADLIREMPGPVTCDFLAVSSYGAAQVSSGQVQLTKDLDASLEGRDVVLVEDIVDTGRTLAYLQTLLRARAPRTLRTACLLSKPSRRIVDVPIDYVGFEIADQFVVGYGLDSNEEYRNLRELAVVRTGSGS
jgi:hypoxanthine phosphoribosyltransferase